MINLHEQFGDTERPNFRLLPRKTLSASRSYSTATDYDSERRHSAGISLSTAEPSGRAAGGILHDVRSTGHSEEMFGALDASSVQQ